MENIARIDRQQAPQRRQAAPRTDRARSHRARWAGRAQTGYLRSPAQGATRSMPRVPRACHRVLQSRVRREANPAMREPISRDRSGEEEKSTKRRASNDSRRETGRIERNRARGVSPAEREREAAKLPAGPGKPRRAAPNRISIAIIWQGIARHGQREEHEQTPRKRPATSARLRTRAADRNGPVISPGGQREQKHRRELAKPDKAGARTACARYHRSANRWRPTAPASPPSQRSGRKQNSRNHVGGKRYSARSQSCRVALFIHSAREIAPNVDGEFLAGDAQQSFFRPWSRQVRLAIPLATRHCSHRYRRSSGPPAASGTRSAAPLRQPRSRSPVPNSPCQVSSRARDRAISSGLMRPTRPIIAWSDLRSTAHLP